MKFFQLKKREGIWLLKGDIFFDSVIARIAEIDRLLKEESARSEKEREELLSEKNELVIEDAFAKQRIAEYCAAHRALE